VASVFDFCAGFATFLVMRRVPLIVCSYAFASVLLLSARGYGAETKAPTNAPVLYRMARLEEAKQRAASEGKPIAWIASQLEYLTLHPKPLAKSSHAATTYAILALQKEAIIVFSDSTTENHQEPGIVDEALHSPDPHYTIPGVIVLTPSLDRVICKVPFTPDSQVRIRVYMEVLKKIRDKDSWAKKP
jgi:hypothetical protein